MILILGFGFHTLSFHTFFLFSFLQGKKVYYHKIIIQSSNGKEIVSVKCITSGPVFNLMMNETAQEQPRFVLQEQQHHGIVRRDVLPAGFQEPE